MEPSTASRTDFIPLRCPSARGRCRSRAHRPLPSMMMATWRGTAPFNRIRARSSSEVIPCSHLHDLSLFRFQQLVDLVDEIVVQLLQILLGVLLVVLGHLVELLDGVATMGARMADRDASLFRQLVDDLHQVATALLVERGQRYPNHVAGSCGIQPQVGIANRLLDRMRES